MITDTGYLIDVLKGDQRAEKKSQDLEDRVQAQNLCTPVLYEVIAGIEYAGSKKEKGQF